MTVEISENKDTQLIKISGVGGYSISFTRHVVDSLWELHGVNFVDELVNMLLRNNESHPQISTDDAILLKQKLNEFLQKEYENNSTQLF